MVSYDFNPPIAEVVVSTGAADQPLAEIQEWLPCVTSWPRHASNVFFQTVRDQYFAWSPHANHFHYSILLHKAESLSDALHAFSTEGAFETHMARSMLLQVIAEARCHTEWCKPEVLAELERYATYAFVLDGTRMTCGCSPTRSEE
jgi:hypothetical protein